MHWHALDSAAVTRVQVEFQLSEKEQSSSSSSSSEGGHTNCRVGNLDSVSKWTSQRLQLWVNVRAAAAAAAANLILAQVMSQCAQCDMWLLASSQVNVADVFLEAAAALSSSSPPPPPPPPSSLASASSHLPITKRIKIAPR
jgi:hypothetical protein